MRSKQAKIYIYAPQHHHLREIEVPNVIYWLRAFKIKFKPYSSHTNMIEVESNHCGNFYFKTMDDPSSLVGYESYAALVDELDTLDEVKAQEIWSAILSRNRQQPSDIDDKFKVWDQRLGKKMCSNFGAAFTTPEGYKFCYKKWQMNPKEGYEKVQGCTLENPNASSEYIQDIRDAHPAHIAEAYLRGEFVNMQSTAVYYNYDVAENRSYETIQPRENLYVGCDFNIDKTAATVYVRRGQEWHALDEFSGIRDAATLADNIYYKYAVNGHHITMYPDASGRSGNNANNANLSSIQELEKRGFTIRANSKNFLIQDRVNATNNAFLKKLLFVDDVACPNASRCLVNQPYDKDGKPCKKTGYDHHNDATTYPIVYELGLRPRLFSIPFSFANKRK